MGKFDNAFSGVQTSTNTGGSSFNAEEAKARRMQQNKERVEIFNADGVKKGRVGIISGIYDLGVQESVARSKSSLSPEEEAEYIEKNPTNWFENVEDYKTKKVERYKCWKTLEKSVALTVDFPQFKYDWGGEIGSKSFRFLLNGVEFTKDQTVDKGVGRLYSLKETTKDFPDKVWSLGKTSVLYKLAVATGVIKQGEPFKPHQIGQLIGKAAYFEVSLSGDYANEFISFKGTVPEGINIPQVEEDELFFVRFDIENDPNHVKQIRWNVLNQMKRSPEWDGSRLKAQYEAIRGVGNTQGTPSSQNVSESNTGGSKGSRDTNSYDPFDGFDLDIPF